MAMLHKRQALGRDFHEHFSLAPARNDTNPPSNKASATEQPAQRTVKQALHSKQHSSRHAPSYTSNHEWTQTEKGGETPPACAPPLSGARTEHNTATATRSEAPMGVGPG